MKTQRKCPKRKLSKQPLALVLIQIRFSPINNLEIYIDQFQDEMRKHDFPLYGKLKNLSVSVTPDGLQGLEQFQWLFKSCNECKSVIIDSTQLTFQTSEYEYFEEFYDFFLQFILCLAKSRN